MTQLVNAETIDQTIQLASSMGFPNMDVVSSLQSISHLFGTTKKRCGIYLLAFQSKLFYIGQSMDVVRRFSQHRRIHADIVGFSFLPVTKLNLDNIEKSLIYKAESLGIKITNAVHVTNVVGDTDFDLIVPISEQNAWLSTAFCTPINEANHSKIILPQAQQLRFSKHYSRFERHPLFQRALNLTKQYLATCVLAPRHTEYSFWSVSCMPSTNHSTWPRLLCLNAGVMELFVVGWERQSMDSMWSFITVAEDVLLEHWGSLKHFSEVFPFAHILRRGYRDAGQHQVTFQTCLGADMEILLANPGVTKAAAALVLRVMRKRATIYGKFHCTQLADSALSK